MIVAAVIRLRAEENGRIHGATGRAVHGFWFRQWEETIPAIAGILHDNNGPQPFTLSPLMGLPRPQRGETAVRSGQTGWMRFVSLHADLSRPLLQSWLTRLPAQIELAGLCWTVQSIALSPAEHPWAGQTSYPQLQAAPPGSKWRFQLHTPTAFRMENGQLPFPLPYSIVNSWLRRWQTFAPTPLPADGLINRLRERLFVFSG
jgi:CRISPR/Cas system endoribonuclease Cas6 (RAMP superfamily)